NNILQILTWNDAGSESVLFSTDLSPFLGTWVEAHEQVTFGWTGSYSLTINRVSDGATLLNYSNNSVQLWRTNSTKMRGKWGIYRSLNNSSFLRDEDVLYGGFCVAKAPTLCGSFASSDFSIGATPSSQTVTAGGSTTYAASVTPSGGFSGTVNLSVNGLPTEATRTFNPTSISGGSGSSTLTISTNCSTPAGNYSLTITGTSGSLSHSASVTLIVNPAASDFTIGASPSSSMVTAGGGASYTVNVGAVGCFVGTVNLSASGLPGGATGTFNPTSISGSGSSPLTGSTTSSTPAGSSQLTITGASGSLNHTASVSLTVNPACTTATANSAWNNSAFPSHSGSFTATFDATPSVSGQSSAVGISKGAQTA